MDIVIVGAGPGGTTAALLLAHAGHDVTLVDRDPGPPANEPWSRVGVMQFHMPQALRAPGRLLLEQRLPEVHQALLDAGAELSDVPPGAPPFATALHVRRSVMERTLWACADQQPGIRRVTGHVDDLVQQGDRVTGVLVDGSLLSADLVVDATGRAGRLGERLRPAAEETPSRFAYAAREYRLNPGAERGPLNGGPGLVVEHHGFTELVFLQDSGTFQTLLLRRSDDDALASLRHESAHTAATAALPGIGTWTEPGRATPIGPVRVGAGLINRYRGQPGAVSGLLAIGDAVLVTNPMGARGVSFALASAGALVDIVAERAADDWATELDTWCAAQLFPWYVDHCAYDHTALTRWREEPLDPSGPIGWDLVVAAATEHSDWMPTLGPFLGMFALPPTIDPLREKVRDMLRDNWEPRRPDGIDRDELAEIVAAALQPATA